MSLSEVENSAERLELHYRVTPEDIGEMRVVRTKELARRLRTRNGRKMTLIFGSVALLLVGLLALTVFADTGGRSSGGELMGVLMTVLCVWGWMWWRYRRSDTDQAARKVLRKLPLTAQEMMVLAPRTLAIDAQGFHVHSPHGSYRLPPARFECVEREGPVLVFRFAPRVEEFVPLSAFASSQAADEFADRTRQILELARSAGPSFLRSLQAYAPVRCPACGHNLQGTETSTCPECGKAVTLEGVMAKEPLIATTMRR